ncbi:MAG: squalene synthase HpnC [Planctomycetota bacterium]|nr:squalene synthase HpnC [Planctomycetota bacterium]
MSSLTINQLPRFGPDQCEVLNLDQARAMCRKLTTGHSENFSVLSMVVPPELRNDFAALYAFCRWADDLGDEISDPQMSLELLDWWRRELNLCIEGQPRHPVFVALRSTIEKHELPIEPFDDLIKAFEQDQHVTRYDTWTQLIEYCHLSADPVGRLVLMICGEPRTDKLFAMSDATCTALQLTNHWQDVSRDIKDRDRIYIPRDLIGIDDFDERLKRTNALGHAPDQMFYGMSRDVIKQCVKRTWDLYEQGAPLLDEVKPTTKPILWLFAAGGQHVLHQIEMWNFETILHRPKLSLPSRLGLVLKARFMARRAGPKGNDAS